MAKHELTPEDGSKGGKKRKRKGIEERMQDFLAEKIREGDDRTKEDILREALLKFALKGNVKAIEVLMDRAYGKAKQVIEGTIDQDINLNFGEVKPKKENDE